MTSRRLFLRNSALTMFGAGAVPSWLARAAAAGAGKRNKVLVAVFQRGAADGLNIAVPFRDPRYYALRPTIAVPPPGKESGAIDLNGAFGLHPSMAPLASLYKDGRLAIVHAAGSNDPTRSHFDAQDYMESGTPGRKSTRDGWLNRALPAQPHGASPIRAIAMGPRLPRSLRGPNPAVAVADIRDFQVKDGGASDMLEGMYSQAQDASLSRSGKDTFEALKLVESIRKQAYTPANGAAYPNGRFGLSLEQIARLIKAGAGLEVAFADLGGWDHHTNESIQLTNLLRQFSSGLAAFSRDLGDRMEDVVLVTMSEFGRTARENGNRGTDHGHANAMFVLGGPVKGGAIYGGWPGLEPEQLYEGRDLAVTTDFRAVLTELVSAHLGSANAAQAFPGFTAPGRAGLLRA